MSLGYTDEEAVAEAKRCLNCKHRPCVSGCPVAVRIPEFILLMTEGNFSEAYDVIRTTNALPAVCGRVCPQESQCEAKCVRGIKGESVAIGRLERFAADFARRERAVFGEKKSVSLNAKKIAVVGSGPSGLSCAGELAARGYSVTVFEALHALGGVLIYGIPEFRLPKEIVSYEVKALENMGVEFKLNTVVGQTITVDELFADGYSAVFVGSGAGLPRFMGIEGEALCGVYSANEYLTRINLMKAYKDDTLTPIKKGKRIAVVGGGNVAMDAARCAKRMGAEHVTIVYRRSEEEMPARAEEVHHAKEEGIEFMMLTAPEKILGDENFSVSGMVCSKMILGDPDASGRRSPVKVEGSEFTLELDTVIIAVGTQPNPLIIKTTPSLESDRHGCLVTSDGVTTTRPMVYAGGDAVTGAATVILAMGAGRKAAQEIDAKLGGAISAQ